MVRQWIWSKPVHADAANDISWHVGSTFTCEERNGCYNIGYKTIGGIEEETLRQIAKRHYPEQLEASKTKRYVRVPYYRSAYSRAENETGAIQYLTGAMPGFEYSDGFACAISDNPNVAQNVADEHSTSVPFDYNSQQKHRRRKVMTTKAQGVQSRPARNPSTAEFADAILDW